MLACILGLLYECKKKNVCCNNYICYLYIYVPWGPNLENEIAYLNILSYRRKPTKLLLNFCQYPIYIYLYCPLRNALQETWKYRADFYKTYISNISIISNYKMQIYNDGRSTFFVPQQLKVGHINCFIPVRSSVRPSDVRPIMGTYFLYIIPPTV